jgi:hypothetical protein
MLCPYKRVKAIPVSAIGVNAIGFYVAGAARLRQNQ